MAMIMHVYGFTTLGRMVIVLLSVHYNTHYRSSPPDGEGHLGGTIGGRSLFTISPDTRNEADASGYTTSGLDAESTARDFEADELACEMPLAE
jgi:hypothetical protein